MLRVARSKMLPAVTSLVCLTKRYRKVSLPLRRCFRRSARLNGWYTDSGTARYGPLTGRRLPTLGVGVSESGDGLERQRRAHH